MVWFSFLTFRVRTSSGTFLARGRDKIIRNIEKKIADFTFLPVGMESSFLIYNFFFFSSFLFLMNCVKFEVVIRVPTHNVCFSFVNMEHHLTLMEFSLQLYLMKIHLEN